MLYLETLTEDTPLFCVLIFYTPHSSEGLPKASLKIMLQFEHIGTKDFPLEVQTAVLIPGLMFFLKSLCILKNTKLHFSPVSDIHCETLGEIFLKFCTCDLQNGHPFLKWQDSCEGQINGHATQWVEIHHLCLYIFCFYVFWPPVKQGLLLSWTMHNHRSFPPEKGGNKIIIQKFLWKNLLPLINKFMKKITTGIFALQLLKCILKL